MNPIKALFNPLKSAALFVAKQAGAFYEIATSKGGNAVSGRTKQKYKQRNKIKGKKFDRVQIVMREKEKKASYKPGKTKLGLSAVSEAIRKDSGAILSRRERRELAKSQGKPFKAYYNGDGPIRARPKTKPNKYVGRKRA